MKKLWILAGVGAVLAACGTSGDGRLRVYDLSAVSEFRDAQGNSVGCDNLNGASVQPTVKVLFTASGFIQTAQVRLIGDSTTDQNTAFVANLSSADVLKGEGTNRYFVRFKAEPGQILPSSVPNIRSQGIVVNPTTTIKNVTVKPADRAPNNGGFRAQLIATSDTGSNTGFVTSGSIPVYSNCTFVSDSSTQL